MCDVRLGRSKALSCAERDSEPCTCVYVCAFRGLQQGESCNAMFLSGVLVQK